MNKDVYIPKKFTIYKINNVLNQIVSPQLKPKSDSFTIHLEEVEFIDPGGITALYNICMWLIKSEEVKADFKINTYPSFRNRQAMEFLNDCDFFKRFFDEEKIFGKSHLRDTTLPIRLLKVKDSYQWNQMTLKNWLQKTTGRYADFSNIQVGIEEIFNNIEDHSSQSIGCVFGQFFPKSNSIVITVSDFGLGIPTVMRTKFPEKDDIELLIEATLEGISTKSTPRNRGAGLPNIINSLTTSNIGTVQILSNYAKVDIRNGIVSSKQRMSDYYPGTFIQLSIDVKNEELYSGEEEDDFKW